MRNVIPTPAVQAAIQNLNRLCREAYGAEAYLALGDGNLGALVVGTRAEVIALANGMEQNQFQPAPQRVIVIDNLLPPPRTLQLPANGRRMLVAVSRSGNCLTING